MQKKFECGDFIKTSDGFVRGRPRGEVCPLRIIAQSFSERNYHVRMAQRT